MTTIDHAHWASYLQNAVESRQEVTGIEAELGSALPIDDAYTIQDLLIQRRIDAGDRLAGAKLGLTSKAKQEQMGVDEPVYGWVTQATVFGADATVDLSELIHPRVEPEIVFVMASSISGADVTREDVLDATERIVGGIEVIDSRYEAFKFTLPDVIADNTSAARVAIGDGGVGPRDVDVREIDCTFAIDGEATGTAAGSALLGDPAECVAMLVRHLAATNRGLGKGWVVPAGAPLDARPLSSGTVATATYSHLGPVTVRGM